MELYLAHQLGNRKDVREWEIRFEKRTGINLINPFYDCPNRKDIKLLDTLNKAQIMEYLVTRDEKDCQTIVERDLALIRKSDGVVAFVTGSIGTSMEVIMAFRIAVGVFSTLQSIYTGKQLLVFVLRWLRTMQAVVVLPVPGRPCSRV